MPPVDGGVFVPCGHGAVSRLGARVAFAALGGGEVSPPEASDFFLGEKVTKTPPKNPWFLGTSFFWLIFRGISRWRRDPLL